MNLLDSIDALDNFAFAAVLCCIFSAYVGAVAMAVLLVRGFSRRDGAFAEVSLNAGVASARSRSLNEVSVTPEGETHAPALHADRE